MRGGGHILGEGGHISSPMQALEGYMKRPPTVGRRVIVTGVGRRVNVTGMGRRVIVTGMGRRVIVTNWRGEKGYCRVTGWVPYKVVSM